MSISKASTRDGIVIWRLILDVVSLGFTEIEIRCQRWSHNDIKAYTECEKCDYYSNYILKFLHSNSLALKEDNYLSTG